MAKEKTVLKQFIDEINFGHGMSDERIKYYLEQERIQIIKAVRYGYKDAIGINPDTTFGEYYNHKFDNL